jgi:hypothetical protein
MDVEHTPLHGELAKLIDSCNPVFIKPHGLFLDYTLIN